ncbi:hypothetical protein [Caballeronia sordidicola]|uniref:hypothetical protein n=1 Tax=Caballeronia sordidicola TaxID=196367 RepID=UPI0004D02620|nr:hypothetical protein [Caballeronia sordidicola]
MKCWLAYAWRELIEQIREVRPKTGIEGRQLVGLSGACGPRLIEQAHEADEDIELAQVDRCLGFLVQLAKRFPSRVR